MQDGLQINCYDYESSVFIRVISQFNKNEVGFLQDVDLQVLVQVFGTDRYLPFCVK